MDSLHVQCSFDGRIKTHFHFQFFYKPSIILSIQGGWRFEGSVFPSISELVNHQYQSGVAVTNKSGTILSKPILRESWELRNDDILLESKIGNVSLLYLTPPPSSTFIKNTNIHLHVLFNVLFIKHVKQIYFQLIKVYLIQ